MSRFALFAEFRGKRFNGLAVVQGRSIIRQPPVRPRQVPNAAQRERRNGQGPQDVGARRLRYREARGTACDIHGSVGQHPEAADVDDDATRSLLGHSRSLHEVRYTETVRYRFGFKSIFNAGRTERRRRCLSKSQQG